MSLKIMIRSIIAQVIMILVLTNIVLNAAGFSGISDTDWVEDVQMMKDRLIDGKEL